MCTCTRAPARERTNARTHARTHIRIRRDERGSSIVLQVRQDGRPRSKAAVQEIDKKCPIGSVKCLRLSRRPRQLMVTGRKSFYVFILALVQAFFVFREIVTAAMNVADAIYSRILPSVTDKFTSIWYEF